MYNWIERKNDSVNTLNRFLILYKNELIETAE